MMLWVTEMNSQYWLHAFANYYFTRVYKNSWCKLFTCFCVLSIIIYYGDFIFTIFQTLRLHFIDSIKTIACQCALLVWDLVEVKGFDSPFDSTRVNFSPPLRRGVWGRHVTLYSILIAMIIGIELANHDHLLQILLCKIPSRLTVYNHCLRLVWIL